MNTNDRLRPRHYVAALALGLFVLVATAVILPSKADAADQGVGTAISRSASYCGEAWQYPNSAGAEWCRLKGWTVKPRLVLSPRSVVKATRLPHCHFEDGSGQRSACTWNIGPRIDGNGIGASYWVDRRDRTHYVWATSPLRPGWHWSKRAQSQALGRSDCVVKNGSTVASGLIARCAG